LSGFCGFTVVNHNNALPTIEAMLDTIAHRGQNFSKTYADEHIALGFCGRDEEPYANSEFSLAFNGEIYNIAELSTMLEKKGYSVSDDPWQEILLQMYKEYGAGMLPHLRGVFAFVIYDITANRLFCARDIFGVKPFYYMSAENGLIFGSEIKSFFKHPNFEAVVNTEALGLYMSFQFSVLNETFFKGVYKLPPGHYLTWEDDTVQISRYNSHLFTPMDMSLEDAVENIDKATCDSVNRQVGLNGEIDEIGSFLSGGVDSGYLTALFKQHNGKKTFTVGFEREGYNEIEHAKGLSDELGIENISQIISPEEYWESLSKIQYHMDEPLADPAAVAFYFACKEASRHVKIALSGEGPDEIFGGYNIYKEPLSLRFYTWLPLPLRKWLASMAKKLPSKIKGRNFLIRGAKTVEERFIGNAYIFSPEERDKLLKYPTIQNPIDITRPYYNQVKHENDITKMQFLDIHLWLTEDILLQADKMSMAHGLKVRVPLLDRDVFRVASCLPVKHRVNKNETKIAFRKAAAKHLPNQVATRKKLGFPVPIRVWLQDEKYYNIVKSHFVSQVAEEYFHVSELVSLLDEHYCGKHDNSRKIWTVYMFLLWYEEFFEKNKPASTDIVVGGN